MSTSQKTPFSRAINQFTDQRIVDALGQLGPVLPCHVTAVNGAIVTVNFDVDSSNVKFTFPPVTCATIGSKYVREPIQIGDYGICIAANVRLGGITGLGTGMAPLVAPSNLGGLSFLPIGNVNWEEVAVNALFLRDATESVSVNIASGAVEVNGNLTVSGNISAGNGITCSFTTVTGQTVTVQNGIITNIF